VNSPAFRRPRSLREVAEASLTYSDFGCHLKDFLHAFHFARQDQLPLLPMLVEEPPRLKTRFLHGDVCDAFLAATADHLSRVHGVPTPEWALNQDLALEEPWFSEEFKSVRLRLLRDTPSAFKDKNLFVFESALSVA
jgi:hypothetical protein